MMFKSQTPKRKEFKMPYCIECGAKLVPEGAVSCVACGADAYDPELEKKKCQL